MLIRNLAQPDSALVTDMCLPDALKPAVIEDIIATANGAEPKLRALVSQLIKHDAAAAY